MSSQAVTNIRASIIHRIIKDVHQQAPNITPPIIRERLHNDDNQVEKLISFLDSQLEKSGLAHSFVSDFISANTLSNVLDNYLFSYGLILSKLNLHFHTTTEVNLLNYRNWLKTKSYFEVPKHSNENPEILFSENVSQTRYRRITNLITSALNYHIYKEGMTTGDHLPIIFYQQDGHNYLYIALLSLKDNITIEESTGEILDTTSIDTSALKVACKIDLDSMKLHQSNITDDNYQPLNYISWVQKGKTEKIQEYIQDFIPVMVRIDDKTATSKLMRSLTSFLKDSDFDNNARGEINSDVIRLLKSKAIAKQPVNIVEEIDPIIETKASSLSIDITNEKNNFKIYRENNGYGVNQQDNSNIFSPEKNPLKSYEKFDISVGDNNDLEISGLQSILGDKVIFNDDPNNPKLEIHLTLDETIKVREVFERANQYES